MMREIGIQKDSLITGIGILILTGALWLRGLYFDGEMMLFLLAMVAILGIHILKTAQVDLDLPAVFLLGIFILSILAVFTGIDWGMGIIGLHGPFMILVGYYFVQALYERIPALTLKRLVLWNIAITCLVSIGGYILPDLNKMSWVIDGRIAGPLQYANSYAAILMVGMLWLLVDQPLKPIEQWGFGMVMGTTLILTFSRSALWLTLGGIIIILVHLFWQSGYKAIEIRVGTIIGSASSIILGFGLAILKQATLIGRLSESVQSASEFQTRLLYYQDAFHILMSKPWGLGYLGYFYYQRCVQTGSTYHVRYVHSSLLQMSLDYGLVAGLMLIGLALVLIFRGKKYWPMNWILLLLFGHSMIDLDAQFPYIWWMIWLLAFYKDKDKDKTQAQADGFHIFLKVKRGWVLVAMSILILWLGYFTTVTLLDDQKEYEKALGLYPVYTEAAKNLLSPQSLDATSVQRAWKVVERNPYIMQGWEVIKIDALQKDEMSLAVSAAARMVAINPLNIRQYEQYGQTLVLAARVAYYGGNYEESKAYLAVLEGLPATINLLAKESDTDYNVNHKPELSVTQTLNELLEIGDGLQDMMR